MTEKYAVRISRRTALGLALTVGVGGLIGTRSGAPMMLPAVGEEHAVLPIGMNISGISDWDFGFPFLNLLWGAREWITQNASGPNPWDTGLTGTLELDEHGYPVELPVRPEGGSAQVVATLLPNTLAPGKYVILYDGEGEIAVRYGSRILDAKPGRIEISMSHNGSTFEYVSIRKSVRGNHIRNLRVLPIEYEHANLEENPFRPEVLEFCKPWHCLRFVDWLSTNDSANQKWSNRKLKKFYTQVGNIGDAVGLFGEPMPSWKRQWASGVAIELCVQLANMTKTDAWLCVPHLADDEYITEMALLVKNQLDPSLRVYVEFSNEIWNWQFLQATWMLRSELAGDLVAATGAQPPWKGGVKPGQFKDGVVVQGAGEGVDHPERIGALFRRCFKIWEDVFTGEDRKRLIRVCAVQAVWADTVNRTLNWVMANGGCDALAMAGYFGADDEVYLRWDAAGERLTADDVIADMHLMIAKQSDIIAVTAGYAYKAGVRLITYEGGQHIQPQGQAKKPYNPALGAAQHLPEMYDLVRQNLDLYAKAGCDLFCAYNSVSQQGMQWGSWGHAERYDQDPTVAPKYRAILQANARRLAK